MSLQMRCVPSARTAYFRLVTGFRVGGKMNDRILVSILPLIYTHFREVSTLTRAFATADRRQCSIYTMGKRGFPDFSKSDRGLPCDRDRNRSVFPIADRTDRIHNPTMGSVTRNRAKIGDA